MQRHATELLSVLVRVIIVMFLSPTLWYWNGTGRRGHSWLTTMSPAHAKLAVIALAAVAGSLIVRLIQSIMTIWTAGPGKHTALADARKIFHTTYGVSAFMAVLFIVCAVVSPLLLALFLSQTDTVLYEVKKSGTAVQRGFVKAASGGSYSSTAAFVLGMMSIAFAKTQQLVNLEDTWIDAPNNRVVVPSKSNSSCLFNRTIVSEVDLLVAKYSCQSKGLNSSACDGFVGGELSEEEELLIKLSVDGDAVNGWTHRVCAVETGSSRNATRFLCSITIRRGIGEVTWDRNEKECSVASVTGIADNGVYNVPRMRSTRQELELPLQNAYAHVAESWDLTGAPDQEDFLGSTFATAIAIRSIAKDSDDTKNAPKQATTYNSYLRQGYVKDKFTALLAFCIGFSLVALAVVAYEIWCGATEEIWREDLLGRPECEIQPHNCNADMTGELSVAEDVAAQVDLENTGTGGGSGGGNGGSSASFAYRSAAWHAGMVVRWWREQCGGEVRS